jgi:hypothetical protein
VLLLPLRLQCQLTPLLLLLLLLLLQTQHRKQVAPTCNMCLKATWSCRGPFQQQPVSARSHQCCRKCAAAGVLRYRTAPVHMLFSPCTRMLARGHSEKKSERGADVYGVMYLQQQQWC